jgi:hypothetical protein
MSGTKVSSLSRLLANRKHANLSRSRFHVSNTDYFLVNIRAVFSIIVLRVLTGIAQKMGFVHTIAVLAQAQARHKEFAFIIERIIPVIKKTGVAYAITHGFPSPKSVAVFIDFRGYARK